MLAQRTVFLDKWCCVWYSRFTFFRLCCDWVYMHLLLPLN